MATHSSSLAWRTAWTKKPGRLQSMESQRIGHKWSNLACTHTNYDRKIPVVSASEEVMGFAIWHSELHPALCDEREGWNGVGGGGRLRKEGTHVSLWPIDIRQKPTQHCKAIILQLKINELESHRYCPVLPLLMPAFLEVLLNVG